jgi:hypothetical protein
MDRLYPELSPQPPLPSGWEMRMDPQGRPYYIDHNNKVSIIA